MDCIRGYQAPSKKEGFCEYNLRPKTTRATGVHHVRHLLSLRHV